MTNKFVVQVKTLTLKLEKSTKTREKGTAEKERKTDNTCKLFTLTHAWSTTVKTVGNDRCLFCFAYSTRKYEFNLTFRESFLDLRTDNNSKMIKREYFVERQRPFKV